MPRRRPKDLPTFRQTIAISRDVLASNPTEDFSSRLEAIKLRHLALGFRYDPDQIHRALSALAHQTSTAAVFLAHRPPNNSRSARSRSASPRNGSSRTGPA